MGLPTPALPAKDAGDSEAAVDECKQRLGLTEEEASTTFADAGIPAKVIDEYNWATYVGGVEDGRGPAYGAMASARTHERMTVSWELIRKRETSLCLTKPAFEIPAQRADAS